MTCEHVCMDVYLLTAMRVGYDLWICLYGCIPSHHHARRIWPVDMFVWMYRFSPPCASDMTCGHVCMDVSLLITMRVPTSI